MASLFVEEDRCREFKIIYSCDLHRSFEIKIGSLEGEREKVPFQVLANDMSMWHSGYSQVGRSDLKVTCRIFANGKPIINEIQTSYKAFSNRWSWNEWITLPIKFSELPRNAVLAFTIWDVYTSMKDMLVGGTSLPVFSESGLLNEGLFDLKVHPNVEGDGNWESTTPRSLSSSSVALEDMDRLSREAKRHHSGQMPKCEWLDRLTFRNIEQINEKCKRKAKSLFLTIEFPKIQNRGKPVSLFYFEKRPEGCTRCWDPYNPDTVMNLTREITRLARQAPAREICTIADPEVGLENLVESKHHKLARSLRAGNLDKDLKPNSIVRDQLKNIMDYPPTKALNLDEQDLVWKFRFCLKSEKKGLAKFLQCVNWQQPSESKQAIELLKEWQPMDVEDALELLTARYSHPSVRRYAVRRLQEAENEDLLLYLLQLVQALKNEKIVVELSSTHERRERSSSSAQESQVVRLDSSTSSASDVEEADNTPLFTPSNSISSGSSSMDCDLVTFLISRACANSLLTNYFFWYLHVEIEEMEANKKDVLTERMYKFVKSKFIKTLEKASPESLQRRGELSRQENLVRKLTNILKMVAKESGNRQRKIEKLQATLTDQGLTSFEPMSLPLDPSVKICGIRAEKATLFKSSQMPCLLHFVTTAGKDYLAIFKTGDDLRQDQLILQTISLMDKLLRKENVDLKLTPYRVLATSKDSGFVQYVESTPVAEVLRTEESIINFFKKHAPSSLTSYGVAPEVMENYVRSVAGYCIITYILGIGDRHLDNLMLTRRGNLFHIDFGFILGRDPKPYPPPMKFCKEMVEGMGGDKSDLYNKCRQYICTAFLQMRRHANVILNLFALMEDANIHDIAMEPDKTVRKVQDKFKLDLKDEEAVLYIQELIDTSVSAVMAHFVEKFHTFTQYWKR